MPYSGVILHSVAALSAGLVVGYSIARKVGRLARRSLFAAVLTSGMFGPSMLELWRTLPSDPLGPIFWAIAIAIYHFVPISIWAASLVVGYHHGRERQLNRQAEEGGLIQ